MNPCWRCDGTGAVREARNGWERAECPSCDGSGQPERLREAQTIAGALSALQEVNAA